MIADKIIFKTINNSPTYIETNNVNDMYNGNYHIIINSLSTDGPFAYFIISKHKITSNAYIQRLNSNEYEIDIKWLPNQKPSIKTINNVLNESYTINIKIYEL